MSVSRRRPRLKDIAARVGVSESAASLALSGKPGVSDATRERVLAVAKEMGWAPNYAARVLSGARSNTVGIVVTRDVETVGSEAFFVRLITGMQSALATLGYDLLMKSVASVEEEVAVYRNWQAASRVDAVALVDLRVNDSRPRLMRELGMPAIIIGGVDPDGLVASIAVNDAAAMRSVVDHLNEKRHREIAYVCGQPDLQHISRRIVQFEQTVGDAGGTPYVFPTDFSAPAATAATKEALSVSPTAVVFDNEFLAMAGLSVIRDRGLSVPDDISVVVWEDSPLMDFTDPPLTALRRDAFALGAQAGQLLLSMLNQKSVGTVTYPVPTLIARDSVLELAQ